MKRHQFIGGMACALATPFPAVAQRPPKLPVLGVLTPLAEPTREQVAASPVARRLAEMGWIDGKTITIDARYTAGRDEPMPELAADLVRKGVDAIWAVGVPAAIAAARATSTLPIVFVRVGRPIELGLAQSLARPGGNATGVTSSADQEVYAKPFEFLRDIKPDTKRAAALDISGARLATVAGGWLESQASLLPDIVARHTGIDVVRYPITKSEDIDAAFAAIVQTRPQAIYVSSSATIFLHRRRIAEFALRQHLPSVSIQQEYVEAGGLLSYGADVGTTVLQSLDHVDRVLRGVKPADIPIEQPTRYDLVLNLKTARELGLKIPTSVLVRADRVVE